MQNSTSRGQNRTPSGTQTDVVQIHSEGQVFEGKRTARAYTWQKATSLPSTHTTRSTQPRATTASTTPPVDVLSKLLAQSGLKRAERQLLIERFVHLNEADQRTLLAQVKRQLRG